MSIKHTALSGKKIIFFGDSIGAGWRDDCSVSDFSNSGGWGKRIADNYGADVTAAADAGCSLSTIRDHEGRPSIVNQIHAYSSYDYDYVLLEGGFNDAMGTNASRTKESAARIGVITDTFEEGTFDTSTFAGGLENAFCYIKKYWPKARVGFVITYFTPLSTYGGYTAEEDSMRGYWNMAKSICDKWGVSYLDLFDGYSADGLSFSREILKTDTEICFPGNGDQIHLNAKGYDIITPFIANWLSTTTTMK